MLSSDIVFVNVTFECFYIVGKAAPQVVMEREEEHAKQRRVAEREARR